MTHHHNHSHPNSQIDNSVVRRRSFLRRSVVLKVGFLLLFSVVVFKLVQIQLVEASYYKEKARRQHQATVPLMAARGSVYDRNGALLVSNTQDIAFGADPKLIRSNAQRIARRFAYVFNKSSTWYLSRLHAADRRFVWLERGVPQEYSERINAAAFEGLLECPEPRRLYSFGRLASHVIGFTDIDNNGLDGIELALDEELKGRNGYAIMQRDARGGMRTSVDYPKQDPIHGNNVVLTLNVEYQAIAEDELRKGIERTKSEQGLVVMVDPATGELLAMANYPTIDRSVVGKGNTIGLKNRVITDMFEPGSVFKIVTAAAALERRVVDLQERFNAERGRYIVHLQGGKTRPITDTHPYENLTFQEAVEVSSNIVFAKISDRVGAEALYTMARNFGFGTKTGVELPGEVGGQLKKPTDWSGTTLNTMAYGYEVGVTPLQIVMAYSAVANGGVLMKPFVVKQILDDQGRLLKETLPQVIRKVIPAETARTLTGLLEGVVERGTGKAGKVPGLRVAGKTGTANRFLGGKYETGNNSVSFIGFFPADEPKVVCLVMLDKPRAGGYTGGTASAPVFKAIASRMSAMSGRFASRESQDQGPDEKSIAVPNVIALDVETASRMLDARGFSVKVQGGGSLVRQQFPAAGSLLREGTRVDLVTGNPSTAGSDGYTVVPNLKGLPVRRAINSVTAHRLDAVVSGSGIVVSQDPSPGLRVRLGTIVSIRCQARSIALVGM